MLPQTATWLLLKHFPQFAGQKLHELYNQRQYIVHVLALFVFVFTTISQEVDTTKKEINWNVLTPVSAVALLVFANSQYHQSEQYWSARSPFHFNFYDDWHYAKGADKLGHAHFSYSLASLTSQVLQLNNVDSNTSLLVGCGVSILHQSVIEIQDGFSASSSSKPYLGFSWMDFGSNILGASLPLLQKNIPELRNVDFKVSFNASNKFKNGYYSSVVDDYESRNHWLSINVYDLLSDIHGGYWSPFVNIAVGHGVRDIVVAPGVYTFNTFHSSRHEFFVSLDWNLKAIKTTIPIIQSLLETLSLYKLPAPCVKIYPELVWYGLRL